jgi:multidrug efflux system membrane fusion protein
VTVPTSAIQRGAPGAYVYVINADNTVSVRQVTTGAVDGNITQVRNGLSAGERVVIDGTDRLRDGLKVTVAAENGHPTAPVGHGPDETAGHQGRHSGHQQSQPLAGSP